MRLKSLLLAAIMAWLGFVGVQPALAQLSAARAALTIDSFELVSFSEVVSITSEVGVVDYLEARADNFFKKLPGKLKPAAIVLKRAQDASLELWSWHSLVLSGNLTTSRRSLSLVLFDASDVPVARYHLENAWPSKLVVEGVANGSSFVQVETVTLLADRLTRVSP